MTDEKLKAIRNDNEKITFDLLPMEALGEVQKVLDFGAGKYCPWNWEEGFKWLRIWNSLIRHALLWAKGEDRDKESGLLHSAHMACNALFLIQHEVCELGVDDRRKSLDNKKGA